MSDVKGCLKPAMIGCGVLVGIGILFLCVAALLAWRSIDDSQVTAVNLTGQIVDQTTGGRGRVILNLAQGEFEILPAEPGMGVSVEARYDEKIYEMKDHLIATDDHWEYRVDYHRTMPALQALFRSLMTKGGDSMFRVYLPVDVLIDLEAHVEQGGLEIELGGLWLNEADFTFEKGGFDLDISRPLKEPINRLGIRGAMGGFQISGLGNASPAKLDIRHRMGGATIDLSGAWQQNSDISIGVRMGGTSVSIPGNVGIEGLPGMGRGFHRDNTEVPVPILSFRVNESMGEIEFVRK